MDRTAYLNRRRAELVNTATVNARAALRAALAEPNYRAGPPMVPIPAPELLTLLRAAGGAGATAPTRKLHASLFRALEDAGEHLTLIHHKGPATAEAVAAVALAGRLAARWLKHQVKLEQLDEARRQRARARRSIRLLLHSTKMGSQNVPPPHFLNFPLPEPANDLRRAARKHWRHRTRAEQAALDLSALRWDMPTPHDTPAETTTQERRRARLATYTAAELAEAAEIRAGRSTQPQEQPDMAKKATSTSTATSPKTSLDAGIPPAGKGTTAKGHAKPGHHGAEAVAAATAGATGGTKGKTIPPASTRPKQRTA